MLNVLAQNGWNLSRITSERSGFYAMLALVVVFLWLPDFPPMVDMPQHAGQVAALKAMIEGEFFWKDLVEVNYFTPYWAAYGIWVLLALLFPFVIATKIIISLTFLSFVLACSFLRKKFNAPPLLDWLLIPAFFGFPYQWGFITFMLAIAVGVWFYDVNTKALEGATWKKLALVFCAGLVLMFSHMMVFAFFVLCAFIYFLCDGRILKNRKMLFSLVLPYTVLFVIFVAFSRVEHPLIDYSHYPSIWAGTLNRILEIPRGVFSLGYNLYAILGLFVLVVASPFILGYRFSRQASAYTLMIAFFCAWIFLPNISRGVFFLHERLAFFFIPAYILCFVRTDARFSAPRQKLAAGFFAILMLALMFYPLQNLYFFRVEAEKFSMLLQKLPEKKRALMAIYARHSEQVKVPNVFIHFPHWYQALKGGWVEYNTAWAYVAPVRYLPDKVPEIRPGHEWEIDLSTLQQCEIYDLIFIRIDADLDDHALSQTQCQDYRLLARQGEWYVFQKTR
jgi:hypothetical protein